MYHAVAIKELQELEAAPLCHRVAARLLVNHCELVDGKDEATVLTDSGHQIRDFVDAFAASLAICDLERGSFPIPVQCANLQEPALTRLSLQSGARIHLSTQEIAGCLTGSASSDAAWVTWVSYRERAVRFCEAARARQRERCVTICTGSLTRPSDDESAQHLLLYRHLVSVISKLSDGVEAELQLRMKDLEASNSAILRKD